MPSSVPSAMLSYRSFGKWVSDLDGAGGVVENARKEEEEDGERGSSRRRWGSGRVEIRRVLRMRGARRRRTEERNIVCCAVLCCAVGRLVGWLTLEVVG